MKTELLILLPDDEKFCNTKKSFIDFLKIDSLITITGNTINFRNPDTARPKVSAKFRVETDKVKSNNERYFLFVLECTEQLHIDEFSELTDRLKSLAERISPGSTVVNMLWDGVGRTYAEKAYPIINEVENLMRRLIAKFMLITVGMHWSRDAINPELFKKIEKFEDEDPYLNDLHKLDFIHLSQVLFEKKRDITLEELDRLLLKTNFSTDDQERIMRYVPRSNWEKYFSVLVDEKDHSLEIKWERLYKLRNKVAHNRSVKKSEFEQINGLAATIKEIIGRATSKLGEIDINEEDRELIMHSYRFESPAAMGHLIERSVANDYVKNGYEIIQTPLNNINQDFDFSATKNGETVAVIVKIFRPKVAYHKLRAILGNLAATARRFPSLATPTIHFVLVFREQDSSYPLDSLLSELDEILEKFPSNVELQIGHLDKENNYIGP